MELVSHLQILVAVRVCFFMLLILVPYVRGWGSSIKIPGSTHQIAGECDSRIPAIPYYKVNSRIPMPNPASVAPANKPSTSSNVSSSARSPPSMFYPSLNSSLDTPLISHCTHGIHIGLVADSTAIVNNSSSVVSSTTKNHNSTSMYYSPFIFTPVLLPFPITSTIYSLTILTSFLVPPVGAAIIALEDLTLSPNQALQPVHSPPPLPYVIILPLKNIVLPPLPQLLIHKRTYNYTHFPPIWKTSTPFLTSLIKVANKTTSSPLTRSAPATKKTSPAPTTQSSPAPPSPPTTSPPHPPSPPSDNGDPAPEPRKAHKRKSLAAPSSFNKKIYSHSEQNDLVPGGSSVDSLVVTRPKCLSIVLNNVPRNKDARDFEDYLKSEGINFVEVCKFSEAGIHPYPPLPPTNHNFFSFAPPHTPPPFSYSPLLLARVVIIVPDVVEHDAAKMLSFPWGELDLTALLSPYTDYISFFRIVLFCKKSHMKNVLIEVAGGLAALDVKVIAASFSTRIPTHINVYLASLDDYIKIHACDPDLLLEGGMLPPHFPSPRKSKIHTHIVPPSLTPFLSFSHILYLFNYISLPYKSIIVDQNPDTELDVKFSLSATNSLEVIRLFVGNVETTQTEKEVLQAIRDVVTTTAHPPNDIFSFSFHRSSNPKCEGKKSSFGFLQVVGDSLAQFLCQKSTQPFLGALVLSAARPKYPLRPLLPIALTLLLITLFDAIKKIKWFLTTFPSVCADVIPLAPAPSSIIEYRANIKQKELWKTEFSQKLFENFFHNTSIDFSFADTPKEKINSATELIQKCYLDALDAVFPIKTYVPIDPASFIVNPSKHKKIKPQYKLYKKLSGVIKYMHKLDYEELSNIDQVAKQTIDYINSQIDYKKHVDPNLDFHTLLNELTKLQTDFYYLIRTNINNIKNKRMRKAVAKKLDAISKEPHKVFKIIHSSTRRPVDVVSVVTPNNDIKLLFENDIVDEIQGNWEKIYTPTKPRGDIKEFLQHMPTINLPLSNPDFSIENMKNILKTKKNTAPGISKITWKCFKHSPDNALEFISELYKAVYKYKIFPKSWLLGITILFEKPTADIGLDKFRPITLLSVEYKLYSHILNDTLNNIIHANNLIPLAQNGFYKDRGSDQCIHTLIQVISDSIRNKRSLYCLYIDFAKAFDSVEHWVLEDIFNHIQLGDLGEAILQTLLNSKTKIKTAHGFTKDITFLRGTKQGDIISPTLFIIFLAPLLWLLKNKKLGYNIAGTLIGALAVADDISLIAETYLNIKTSFEWTNKYAIATDIKIKPAKSASAYRSPTPYIPIVNNIPFENLAANKSYKYLGVMINLNLNWDHQKEVSASTYKNTIHMITKKFYLSCKQHVKLINAIAIASLRYRMQFLYFEDSWLEKMTNWTIKLICSTHCINTYRTIPTYWHMYKGLISLKHLNLASYISNLHKNLNKTELIAYPLLNNLVGPFLNSFPGHSLINTSVALAFKNTHIDIISLSLILHIKNTAASHVLQSEILLAPISALYHIHLTPSLFNVNSPPVNIRLGPDYMEYILTGADGSVIGDNMGSAIASPMLRSTLAFTVAGPINTAEPELQGIENIILLFHFVKHIYIFTDSLTALTLITNFNSYNTNRQLKTVNRATVKRILNHLKLHNRTITNKLYLPPDLPPSNSPTLTIYHIHSHMLENKSKATKHLQTHTRSLKHLTEVAIDLNAKADMSASNIIDYLPSPMPKLITEGNDTWQAIDRRSDTPIYNNLFKIFYFRTLQEDINLLKNSGWEFAKRLFHPEVSPKLTTLIFRDDNPKYAALADFLQKLLDKSLPTRKKMIFTSLSNKFVNKLHPLKKLKLANKYASSICVYCKVTYNISVIEDNKHIFTDCKQHESSNLQLYSDIIGIINSLVPNTKINECPIWFTCNKTTYASSDCEKLINNFPKILGDMGLLPKALKQWIKEMFPKKLYNTAIKNITVRAQMNCLTKWKVRCQFLEDNYKLIL